jgi:predicted DNA-binding antitoxin AbrB/MazE fold protein
LGPKFGGVIGLLRCSRSDVMRTIAAIYENGVFRPKERVSLPPGAEVEVIVPDERRPEDIMSERYPLSFGALTDSDAAEMKRVIEEECERIEPDA